MSSLWTPEGERPVGRSSGASGDKAAGKAADEAARGRGGVWPGGAELGEEERAQAEELAREMAAVREQLARTPAAVVVANHVMGFYELAAIHLSQQPANFPEASVAIDAMSSVLDKLRGRLGENEQTLRDALSQLQLAYVQLQSRAADDDASSA